MWKWIKDLNPFAVELRNTEARLEFARVLLAQAEIELADKAFYVREFAAVSAERDGLQKRNDVQAEQLRRLDSEISPLMAELADLRERAAVPVPEGLPTADELAKIGADAWNACAGERHLGVRDRARATAIRDAVLAGVVGEKPITPTTDQVEATAEGFEEEHRTYMRRLARAAIAHLSKRPAGLPTAEDLRAAHMKYVEGYRKGENDGSMCATDFALHYLAPYLRQSVEGE